MSTNVILTEPADKRRRVDETNGKRIKFILKENTQLKEQVKDLKNLIELNREALYCMTVPTTGQPTKTGKDQRYSEIVNKPWLETASTLYSRGDDTHWADNPAQNNLISLFIQENRKLAEKLDAVIEERNMAQNREYLNERIIQQNIEYEDDITMEFKDKIETLKMNIRTKEYILHEFECQRMIPADQSELDANAFIVFREITAPYKLVNSITNEKKALENELIEERIASSKIRKDYKNLYDKSSVVWL